MCWLKMKASGSPLTRWQNSSALIKAEFQGIFKNIFETGELEETATVAKIATVQTEGGREVNRNLEFYNLDMIISVGYRVNSIRGTHFRIWATKQLKELIIKGFVLDNQKLKVNTATCCGT